MRTIIGSQLQQYLELGLIQLNEDLFALQNRGLIAFATDWRLRASSLTEAEEALSKRRQEVLEQPSTPPLYYPCVLEALEAETWRFALWLKDHSGYEVEGVCHASGEITWHVTPSLGSDHARQQKEEIELLYWSSLGAEIKRLGFVLAEEFL